jgi:hypothetical protein
MAIVTLTTKAGQPTFTTLKAAFENLGTLTKDEIIDIDTTVGEDVGDFWSSTAFPTITNYTLTIRGKNGVAGNLKSTTDLSALYLDNINNVILQDLNLISTSSGSLASIRLKNCVGIYANNITCNGAKYAMYVENCTSVYLKNITTLNITVESAFITNCLGVTIDTATLDFIPTLSTTTLTPIRANSTSHLSIINVTSLFTNVINHMKIVNCSDSEILRCDLRNAKGAGLYLQKSSIAVRNNLIWDNGTSENGTAAILGENCVDVKITGNTIRHLGFPLSYGIFIRDNSGSVSENYNNIILVEPRVGSPAGSNYFIRIELASTSSLASINSDKNLYYTSHTTNRFGIIKFGTVSTDYNTFSAYKAGTLKDTNSLIASPSFQTGTFLLTLSTSGQGAGDATKGDIYTKDFKTRDATIDIGAFDNGATTTVIANITPGFKAIDSVSGTVYTNPFSIPAYNEVLLIANNNGFPDKIKWDIAGISTTKTIGRYKKMQWNLDSGFGAMYDVVLTYSKATFTDAVLTSTNFVTVIKRYPVPKFSLSGENIIYVNESLSFVNTSIAADTYVWEIKDSSNAIIHTVTTTNITNYQFQTQGVFSVSLKGVNTTGEKTFNSNNIVQVTTASLAPRVGFTVPNDGVVRKGQTLQFTSATSAATAIEWEFPGGTPAKSNVVNPIITYSQPGHYDVKYTVTINGQKISTFHRRKIYCARPLTTTGTVHNIVFTGTESLVVDGSIGGVPVLPGDIIKVSGSGRGLLLKNLIGTAENPIQIQNVGLVTLINSDLFYCIKISDNCAHLTIDGKADSNYVYGFYLEQTPENKNGAGTLDATSKATDFEIFGVEIGGAAFAGIRAKTDSASVPRSAFTQKNTIIHRNYIHDIEGEGMYLGHFTVAPDSGVAPGYLAPELHYTKVFKNKVYHCGNDGIQLGCGTVGSEIHDNDIQFCGNGGSGGQNSALSINSGFVGHIYNNRCIGTDKSSCMAVQSQGNTYIFGNTFAGTGPNDYCMYGISDSTTAANIEVILVHNTWITQGGAFAYNYKGGNKWGKFVMENNVIVKDSISAIVKYFGTSALTNEIRTKNIIKTYGDSSSLLFSDELNGDLRVGPGSEALTFDGADLSQHISLPWGPLTDQKGIILPLIAGYPYGAHTLYLPNSITSTPISTVEGVLYKIYCTNPNGWQYGFATDALLINAAVAPQNSAATTNPNSLVILSDTRNISPFPLDGENDFGNPGEYRYSNSILAVCIKPRYWVHVLRPFTVPTLTWDTLTGKPESSPDQIDEAVRISQEISAANGTSKVKSIVVPKSTKTGSSTVEQLIYSVIIPAGTMTTNSAIAIDPVFASWAAGPGFTLSFRIGSTDFMTCTITQGGTSRFWNRSTILCINAASGANNTTSPPIGGSSTTNFEGVQNTAKVDYTIDWTVNQTLSIVIAFSTASVTANPAYQVNLERCIIDFILGSDTL